MSQIAANAMPLTVEIRLQIQPERSQNSLGSRSSKLRSRTNPEAQTAESGTGQFAAPKDGEAPVVWRLHRGRFALVRYSFENGHWQTKAVLPLTPLGRTHKCGGQLMAIGPAHNGTSTPGIWAVCWKCAAEMHLSAPVSNLGGVSKTTKMGELK